MNVAVHDKMTQVFRRVFDDDNLTLSYETTAQDVSGWDSLTHITLIIEIEEAFALKFTVDDITGLRNVGEMVDMIDRKMTLKSGHA